ncbi:hypothetical protein D3C85_1103680 [compost metagenome]
MANNTTGGYNTALGGSSLSNNTTGEFNVAIGESALQGGFGASGNNNTVVGYAACQNASSANENVVVGYRAFQSNTTGSNNVVLGTMAGNSDLSGGTNLLATNCVYIGKDTRPLISGGTNEIIIGHTAIGSGSNTTTIGNTSILKAKINGQEILAPLTTNAIITSEATGKILITKEYLSTYAPLTSPSFTGVPTAPTAAPGTNTNQIATTAFVLANSVGNSISGSYTPTLTNGNNVDATTIRSATYMKTGDIVNVRVSFYVTPVSATSNCNFQISLPFNRTTGFTQEIGSGTINETGAALYYPAILQSLYNNTVTCFHKPSSTGLSIGTVSFQYSILD